MCHLLPGNKPFVTCIATPDSIHQSWCALQMITLFVSHIMIKLCEAIVMNAFAFTWTAQLMARMIRWTIPSRPSPELVRFQYDIGWLMGPST